MASEVGEQLRSLFLNAEMTAALADAVRNAYQALAKQSGRDDPDVAVRSSATAEDLPMAFRLGTRGPTMLAHGRNGEINALVAGIESETAQGRS